MSVSTSATQQLPDLTFRLIGTWHRVDLTSAASITRSATDIARTVIGKRDENANARAAMRRDLIEAATTAIEGQARLMLFSTEIAPGAAMPVSLTVYQPETLRLSPAVGTSADAVLGVLERGFAELGAPGIAHAVRVSSLDGPALRLHHIDEISELDRGVAVVSRRLRAEYWYPVPGTKRVVLASLATPLGDIATVMLSFFDAIVAASGFGDGAGAGDSRRGVAH